MTKGDEMKVKVIIEETISQEFEVEVTDLDKAYEEIRDKYKTGILELSNPALLDAQLGILDKNGQVMDWNNLL
jgi:hypothetical protein